MRKILPCLFLTAICVSVSLGEFDYTISGTDYEGGVLTLNSESFLMTGGVEQIDAKGSSYVEIQNTLPLQVNIGGINTLNLDGDSLLNYYDGEMNAFDIWNIATATFSGGSINYIFSHQFSDTTKHITFICDVDSVNYNETSKLLTGDWLNDGGSFSITLQNDSYYDSTYSNIQFIPEPTTLALLGLGGLWLRKRRL